MKVSLQEAAAAISLQFIQEGAGEEYSKGSFIPRWKDGKKHPSQQGKT